MAAEINDLSPWQGRILHKKIYVRPPEGRTYKCLLDHTTQPFEVSSTSDLSTLTIHQTTIGLRTKAKA